MGLKIYEATWLDVFIVDLKLKIIISIILKIVSFYISVAKNVFCHMDFYLLKIIMIHLDFIILDLKTDVIIKH